MGILATTEIVSVPCHFRHMHITGGAVVGPRSTTSTRGRGSTTTATGFGILLLAVGVGVVTSSSGTAGGLLLLALAGVLAGTTTIALGCRRTVHDDPVFLGGGGGALVTGWSPQHRNLAVAGLVIASAAGLSTTIQCSSVVAAARSSQGGPRSIATSPLQGSSSRLPLSRRQSTAVLVPRSVRLLRCFSARHFACHQWNTLMMHVMEPQH